MPYPADDANIPLEVGAVVSVETTLKHPTRGFIKLEDTVVVTEQGHEIYGEGARGWNRAGTAVSLHSSWPGVVRGHPRFGRTNLKIQAAGVPAAQAGT